MSQAPPTASAHAQLNTWPAFSYEQLCRLKAHYCRARSRVDVLGGRSDAVRAYGAVAMDGTCGTGERPRGGAMPRMAGRLPP